MVSVWGQRRNDLQDGDAHEADTVVGQQLDFDGGGAKEGDAEGADVRGHGGQSDLEPQLASQVEVGHQHWDLQQPGQCSVSASAVVQSESHYSQQDSDVKVDLLCRICAFNFH